MKTEEIFKRIYQDLKEKMINNDKEIFVQKYEIPSANYSNSENIEDLWWASGIEMELEQMMKQFDYNVFFSSYKDQYFFSNSAEKAQESMLQEVDNDKTELDKLKEQLEEKLDNEFKEFIEDLKKCAPEIIIDRAYEKVSKEEMIYKIKDKDYTVSNLKALLKTDGILQECYDEWLKSDGNFNEVLEYAVDDRIDLIIEDYNSKEKNKNIESR